ncbi:MAG: hypothetical protein IE916_03140, partial [Epsilonproteobacteria bacterium]|nr:hypothetical protein [Campylobacterota bacterium]
DIVLHLSILQKEIASIQYLPLVYKEFQYKSIGTQKLPVEVHFQTQQKFLDFIGKSEEFWNYKNGYEAAVNNFPPLRKLFLKKPMLLLESLDILDKLLAVTAYFVSHPKPNIYIRELPIDGIDTKFMQQNAKVIDLFLSTVLDEENFDKAISKLSDFGFEKKYGLKYPLPTVRFRILDEKHYIHGLSDLSITLEEFAQLDLACENVFVVENKITTLAFPHAKDTIVIFGNGYGVGQLKDITWLMEKNIYYWGDIDVDGFAILSQARSYFSHLQSFCMDKEIIEQFKSLAVESENRQTRRLEYLTHEEQIVYERLANDYYGKNFRLEQERINFEYIKKSLLICLG